MDRLKDKTILIGKEQTNGRLLVSMVVNGQAKMATVGECGSVPNCVSRCSPAAGIAHCKITIDNNGVMTLVNLKPQNVTYVNGFEIVSKKITTGSKVELGIDKYPLPLDKVFEVAKTLAPSLPPPPKSIRHLETVWREYERTNEEISRRIQEKSRRRMTPMAITSTSGALVALAAFLNIEPLKLIGIPCTAIAAAFYIYRLFEKDTSLDEKKAAQDKLIDNYVCPHEDCKQFLGSQPYKVIRRRKKCPYCGKPWKE